MCYEIFEPDGVPAFQRLTWLPFLEFGSVGFTILQLFPHRNHRVFNAVRCQVFCNVFEEWLEIILEFEKEVHCEAINVWVFGAFDSSKSNQNQSDLGAAWVSILCAAAHIAHKMDSVLVQSPQINSFWQASTPKSSRLIVLKLSFWTIWKRYVLHFLLHQKSHSGQPRQLWDLQCSGNLQLWD